MDQSTVENAVSGIFANDLNGDSKVTAKSSNFLNNQTDVKLVGAIPHVISNTINIINSSFENCVFKANAHLIDGSFPNAHCKMEFCQSVLFSGNTFEGEGNNGIGLIVRNSKFLLSYSPTAGRGNIFQNLYKGVDATNIADVEPIRSTKFIITNFNNVRQAITLTAFINFTIESNKFNIPSAATEDNFALKILACNNYYISDNILSGGSGGSATFGSPTSYGIVCHNTGMASGNIFRNQFSGFDVEVQTQEANHTLKVRCNTFGINNNYPKVTGLAVFKQLRQQGADCGATRDPVTFQFTNVNQAGNEWLDPNASILGSGEIAIKVDQSSGATFKYFAHELNNITQSPSTYPGNNTRTWAYVNPSNPNVLDPDNNLQLCGGINKTDASCNALTPGIIISPGTEPGTIDCNATLSGLQTQISNLSAQVVALAASLAKTPATPATKAYRDKLGAQFDASQAHLVDLSR